MTMPRLAVNAHPARALLAVGLVTLAGACSSSSSSPGADLSACDGNVMVTLNAVAVAPGPVCDPTKPTTLKIHYHRDDGDYAGWGLHVWTLVPSASGAPVVTETAWASPLAQAGTDAFGVYFQPAVLASSGTVGYIFHKGDTKDLPDDQSYALKCGDNEIWRLSGDTATY